MDAYIGGTLAEFPAAEGEEADMWEFVHHKPVRVVPPDAEPRGIAG
ncbi:hypothetical protein MUK60_36325 [Streptomyces sp. LRE541]|nr:hypothetical protein [Streptomyces sp. LRE541]UPZ32779.1 hypothetical protein MUK60_36325 [Streptomyces sp. LRE541]